VEEKKEEEGKNRITTECLHLQHRHNNYKS